MKISFCTIAFQKNKWGSNRTVEVPLRDILPVIGRSGAGYDGAELWYPHVEGADLAAIKAQLAAEGLTVPVLSSYYDFTTADETAAASLAHAKKVLADARALGAAALRIFTGRTGSAGATPEQWSRATRALQELADLAAPTGIRLACETHTHNLMDTVPSSRELLRRVSRPNVGLILQPSTFEDGYLSACEALAPYAVHVHATNARDGKWTDLAGGTMDYRQIIPVLRRHGFTGYVSVEWMGEDPVTIARQEVVYLRRLLDHPSLG